MEDRLTKRKRLTLRGFGTFSLTRTPSLTALCHMGGSASRIESTEYFIQPARRHSPKLWAGPAP